MEESEPISETDDIRLRNVITSDLAIFFDQQLDADANRMAAFTSKDPHDRNAFMSRWTKNLANETGIIQTILF